MTDTDQEKKNDRLALLPAKMHKNGRNLFNEKYFALQAI